VRVVVYSFLFSRTDPHTASQVATGTRIRPYAGNSSTSHLDTGSSVRYRLQRSGLGVKLPITCVSPDGILYATVGSRFGVCSHRGIVNGVPSGFVLV